MELSSAQPLSLTEQLRQLSNGNSEWAEAVWREVFPELHRAATRELGRKSSNKDLSPTELIHEAWLRNLRKGGWTVKNREHFYSIAALAMREVIIDQARFRLARKRGGGKAPQSLDGSAGHLSIEANAETMVEIGILMERLQKKNSRAAMCVNMHYFAGFTLEEIAEISGLTFRQVRHLWEFGRDWLKLRMKTPQQ